MSADAYLGENTKTVVLKPWPTVTFMVNGTGVTQQANKGSFVLPDTVNGLDESKYITQWEFNGILYAAGDTVQITGDCTITATAFGNKYIVTMEFADKKTHTFYSKPNDSLVLEECSAPEGKVFSHWDVNGVAYQAGDTVSITEDTVMKAVFKDPANDKTSNAWVAVLIIVIVFLVVIGIGVTVIVLIKRKKVGTEE